MAGKITGPWAELEKLIKGLGRLRRNEVAQEIARRANDDLTGDLRKTFDQQTDPYGAPWDAHLDGSRATLVQGGDGRDSLQFVAMGHRVRLQFIDYLKYHLRWRKRHGGGDKQMFMPSMSKLPTSMFRTLERHARDVLEEYTGLPFDQIGGAK